MSSPFREQLREVDRTYTEVKKVLLGLYAAAATEDQRNAAQRLLDALENLGEEIIGAYQPSC